MAHNFYQPNLPRKTPYINRRSGHTIVPVFFARQRLGGDQVLKLLYNVGDADDNIPLTPGIPGRQDAAELEIEGLASAKTVQMWGSFLAPRQNTSNGNVLWEYYDSGADQVSVAWHWYTGSSYDYFWETNRESGWYNTHVTRIWNSGSGGVPRNSVLYAQVNPAEGKLRMQWVLPSAATDSDVSTLALISTSIKNDANLKSCLIVGA